MSRTQGGDGDSNGNSKKRKRSEACFLQGRLLIRLPALASLFSSTVPQPQRELRVPRASEFQGAEAPEVSSRTVPGFLSLLIYDSSKAQRPFLDPNHHSLNKK